LPLLTAELDKKLPAEMPSSDEQREALAKRQANAAVALVRLSSVGRIANPSYLDEKVWPLLAHSSDPRVRSYLIHRLAPLGADAGVVIQRLEEEPDLTIRRVLLLSLGEYSEAEVPPATRRVLMPKLHSIYQTDPDPGLHASVEWLLRQWKDDAWLKQKNDEWARGCAACGAWRLAGKGKLVPPPTIGTRSGDRAPTGPGWYVNTQGQTCVVIPGPVEFQMGSPPSEKDRYASEVLHKRRIGRSFSIASKPVTLEQYRRLTKARYAIGAQFTHDPNLPVVGINWYMAANYCNLLSKAEGIPEDQWCYEINRNVTRLKAHYLSLTGYRLPTEAEMEYATRAKAVTSRYYGETVELLGAYAWYTKSSNDMLKPVGLKKPNDLGLFDALGNCFTWCQEAYADYPKAKRDEPVEDKEGDLGVPSTVSRVMRGGSYFYHASFMRSAYRDSSVPAFLVSHVGFRVARTLPLDGFPALPIPAEGGAKRGN
jgi:formylglycine-generating enzyme required for sulfatase activity